VTGRGATACALYAGFLACWAFGDAARRRAPSPYLALGAAFLEAALVLAALVGFVGLGDSVTLVHAGYLLASVGLLPLGLLLARDPESGTIAAAPLAVCLLALAVVIVRVDATA